MEFSYSLTNSKPKTDIYNGKNSLLLIRFIQTLIFFLEKKRKNRLYNGDQRSLADIQYDIDSFSDDFRSKTFRRMSF